MKLREWIYSIREIFEKRENVGRQKENTHQLVGEKQDGLQTELAVTEVEKIL